MIIKDLYGIFRTIIKLWPYIFLNNILKNYEIEKTECYYVYI